MGIEFTIVKEMASISATLSELAGVNAILTQEIESADFHNQYNSLLFDIVNTYRIVNDLLVPLTTVREFNEFTRKFGALSEDFAHNYQRVLSEPRVNAEFTFEKYLQFRKRREVSTTYPVLSKSFSRLHDFIDKWIDNDIWLAMSIDTLLKMLYRFLGEVDQLKKQDAEAAFNLYQSCVGNMHSYLQIIESQLKKIGEKPFTVDYIQPQAAV